MIQTGKIYRFPVVFFGKKYWSGLIAWIKNAVLAGKKISRADLDLMMLTDDPKEAAAGNPHAIAEPQPASTVRVPEPELTRDELIARAVALRPKLRELQDEHAEAGTYSDALHEEYKKRGTTIRQGPTNYPWGLREMNVEDPDGHRLRMGSAATGPAKESAKRR